MRTTLIGLVTCYIDLKKKKKSAVFKKSDHLPTSFQKAVCGTTLHTSLNKKHTLFKLPRMYGQTPHLSFCLSLCNITTLVLKTSIRSPLLNHFWCTNPKKDSRPGGPSVSESGVSKAVLAARQWVVEQQVKLSECRGDSSAGEDKNNHFMFDINSYPVHLVHG